MIIFAVSTQYECILTWECIYIQPMIPTAVRCKTNLSSFVLFRHEASLNTRLSMNMEINTQACFLQINIFIINNLACINNEESPGKSVLKI